MALADCQVIENVLINGSNKPFGGYLYNFNFNFSLNSPSRAEASIISKDGTYQFSKDDLSGENGMEIKIGDSAPFKMLPVGYSKRNSSSGEVLSIKFSDMSSKYLDKYIVAILGWQIPEKEKHGRIITIGKLHKVGIRPSTVKDNATALGENTLDELSFEEVKVFDKDVVVTYTLDNLLDKIIKKRIPVSTAAQNVMQQFGERATFELRKDHFGTLRDVLASWGRDIGYLFYWNIMEGGEGAIDVADLKSNVFYSKINQLKAEVLKMDDKITSMEESYSIEDNFAQLAIGHSTFEGRNTPRGYLSCTLFDPIYYGLFDRLYEDNEDFIRENVGTRNFRNLVAAALVGPDFYRAYILWHKLIKSINDKTKEYDNHARYTERPSVELEDIIGQPINAENHNFLVDILYPNLVVKVFAKMAEKGTPGEEVEADASRKRTSYLRFFNKHRKNLLDSDGKMKADFYCAYLMASPEDKDSEWYEEEDQEGVEEEDIGTIFAEGKMEEDLVYRALRCYGEMAGKYAIVSKRFSSIEGTNKITPREFTEEKISGMNFKVPSVWKQSDTVLTDTEFAPMAEFICDESADVGCSILSFLEGLGCTNNDGVSFETVESIMDQTRDENVFSTSLNGVLFFELNVENQIPTIEVDKTIYLRFSAGGTSDLNENAKAREGKNPFIIRKVDYIEEFLDYNSSIGVIKSVEDSRISIPYSKEDHIIRSTQVKRSVPNLFSNTTVANQTSVFEFSEEALNFVANAQKFTSEEALERKKEDILQVYTNYARINPPPAIYSMRATIFGVPELSSFWIQNGLESFGINLTADGVETDITISMKKRVQASQELFFRMLRTSTSKSSANTFIGSETDDIPISLRTRMRV